MRPGRIGSPTAEPQGRYPIGRQWLRRRPARDRAVAERQTTAVILPKSNRKIQRSYDKEFYKVRHLVENSFCKLKQFRAIATRYDKTAHYFLAAIHLASAVIWLI
ncbi:MAG: transposase [Candidatus Competibacteraceae bacterium]|nr:transposase [Candidatus Competibacteraceae bacterium]